MIKLINKKVLMIFVLIIAIIVVVVYFISKKEVQPQVTSTTPADQSTNITETSQISINFGSIPSDKSKGEISVTTDPAFDFDSTWLTYTLKIIPKENLQNDTTYKINVLFNKKQIYNFSFETEIFSQEQIQKYGALQTENDYAVAQVTKSVVEKYPWYTSLPIKTSDYVIYYDFNQQKFAITFLKTETTDQQKTLIQDAITNIQKIGVKSPVQYYTNTP